MSAPEKEDRDPEVESLLNPRDWLRLAKPKKKTANEVVKDPTQSYNGSFGSSLNLKEELESCASDDEKEAFFEEDDWEVGMIRNDPSWEKKTASKAVEGRTPKKRGRPRKGTKQGSDDENGADPDWNVMTAKSGHEDEENKVKKKRGRPKKNPEKEEQGFETGFAQPDPDYKDGPGEDEDDGFSEEEDEEEYEEKPKSKYKKQYYKSRKPEPKFCTECGEKFSGKTLESIQARLDNHELDHKVEKFTCECPEAPKLILNSLQLPRLSKAEKYLNFKEVKQHLLVVHMGWHGCKKCPKTFKTRGALEEHQTTGHQSLVCDECGYVCTSQSTMYNHKNALHKEKTKIKHRKKRVENGDEDASSGTTLCPDCGADILAKNMQRHKLVHTIENFTCDCPDLPSTFRLPELDGFGQSRAIGYTQKERHMKVVHMGWLPCSETGCQNSFETKLKLERHVKTHKQICDHCGFQGKTAQHLRGHFERNHDTKAVQCPDCGEMQTNKHELYKHKKKVHTRKTCGICGAEVKCLTIHMRNQHISDDQARYKCEYCQKGFMDKPLMDKHIMNVHIRTQPYKCRYGCENAYNDKSNRAAHERRRHGSCFPSPTKSQFSLL